MLEVNNLCYSIQNKALIKDISLSFQPGILYGILGLNGSGKSTLLKTLTGIWKPTQGSVFWNNQNLLSKKRRIISQTISWVPQNPQVHFNFTVEEFVTMGRYPLNKALQSSSATLKALQVVDAWHLRQRLITQLSSGERQRVYIARALITQAPILLLDEPTTSLDVRHQLEIWILLRRLLKQDKTIIVALHDLSAAQRFCDKIVLIHHGRCIAEGPFDAIITPQRLQDIFGIKQNINNTVALITTEKDLSMSL